MPFWFQVVGFILTSLYLMSDAKMPPVKKTVTVKDDDGNDRVLVFHRGKGRHQINAQNAAGEQRTLIPASLVQQLVTLDGKKLTLDEWLDVDLGIFLEAQHGVFDTKPGKEKEAAY